ncbi:MAG: AAA family ATPase [Spirulinaceae cyanobacterium]
MLNLAGYCLTEQLYESTNSLVFRGIREKDGLSVILKVLKKEYPSPQELSRYQKEYEITRKLQIPGVIAAYSQESQRGILGTVLEDFGGQSLKQLRESPLPLAKFLPLAIEITQILGEIHHHKIIHKDINPSNILLNSETGQVKIIDFGISTTFSRENPLSRDPDVLEGTLAYVSPEQTGRTNSVLDYRTDFYSVGVTFYELLTGKLPFASQDAMELIHCHLAKRAKPFGSEGEIPQMLSEIVIKLMAKNPEDRYQSALGLKYDLQKCWQQWQETGEVEAFTLGEKDISDAYGWLCLRFMLPDKLYGREAEIAQLSAAFVRVTTSSLSKTGRGGIELLLIAGYSGIGKSSLINQFRNSIAFKQHYFISGKFDQFQRNVPYSAVVKALKVLVEQLLSESEEQLQQWRTKLLQALGTLGRVITEVIPEVELIIGSQPSITKLGATESQNRFNFVFSKFIKAFCCWQQPLIIFLDDLQWADAASLKLIQIMMAEVQEGLLLIGAYRDNEVTPTHPLMLTLEAVGKEGSIVKQITLTPLTLEQIQQLIAATLHHNLATVQPLAELVLGKTAGNPFFVREFLKALYEEELITFCNTRSALNDSETVEGGWQWNLAEIEERNITDNVVELTIAKIHKLRQSSQQVLCLAACVGANFDLNTLVLICDHSVLQVREDLTVAVQANLIYPLGQSDYKFAHDRIQQAAYALIKEGEKQAVHLKIGRQLWQNTNRERLFEIVDHLNIGITLVSETKERDEIAQLNLLAGKKAEAATAYEAAFEYFHHGLALLTAQSWQSHYDLTLDLHSLGAEAASLKGDWQQQATLCQIVQQQGKTLADKVKVQQVQLQAAMSRNKQLEAWQTALIFLKQLGVEFPQQPGKADLQQAFAEVELDLKGKQPLELLHLPGMKDAQKLAAMQILSNVFSAAFQAVPAMFPLIVCRQVSLSIQYGNATVSAFAYATYGLILCGIKEDFESGYQFGQLALGLLERDKGTKVKTRTMQIVYSFLCHWQEPVIDTLQPLQEAYKSAWETGDVEYGAYCAAVYWLHKFFLGEELGALATGMAQYSEAIAQLKQETALNYHQVCHQVVLNLQGESQQPYLLQGEAYDEVKMLPLHQQANDKTALYYLYFNKAFLHYLFAEYLQAAENIAKARQYLDGVTAALSIPLFYFYDSLIQLAQSQSEELLLQVKVNQEKMQQWANRCPSNFLPKLTLVEAERYQVEGNKAAAIDSYDLAIAQAQENNYLNEEALANELAAKFYFNWGKPQLALFYLKEAYHCYLNWGATAKVKALQKQYPQLQTKPSAPTQLSNTTITTTSQTLTTQLDLGSVLKASQAISGEIVLPRLLEKLMAILIANAGAQIGYLILETKGKLFIEAAKGIEEAQVSVLESISLKHNPNLARNIVNYVWRTRKDVVLENATGQTQFSNDPYIKKQQPKSILCTPLINQGQLSGILYLENNLTTGAFTPERLQVLQLLSGEAAIAIDNARLYNNLEQKVTERTAELSTTLRELESTQDELIQAEKMAALGQLVAGVAHEINTPLGAIRSSVQYIGDFMAEQLAQLPGFFQNLSEQQQEAFLVLLQRSQENTLIVSGRERRKLRKALTSVLETQKVAKATNLANLFIDLGIYTDIEPFFPILQQPDSESFLKIVRQFTRLQQSTRDIHLASDRAAKVVFALKTYARYDQTGERREINILDGIEAILTLYQSQLKQGVKLVRNYQDLPSIKCYFDELNQVWTNLIHNALQAMNNRGTLTINTWQEERQIKVSITDCGGGIPTEIQSKIFQPFFTTKPPGEGSGLGLDIVKKIIKKHQGEIKFTSKPGETSFTVSLPI